MKIISFEQIENLVCKLFSEATLIPSPDVCAKLADAHKREVNPYAKEALSQMLKNIEIAKETGLPSCQDTGMAVVFLEVGTEVHIDCNLQEAINAGVRRAYREGFFRMSVLDPITRINTNDNTPAIIHTEIVKGGCFKITVAPKGFGSENMSVLKMLTPSDGEEGIINTVLEAVSNAGGSPCPPVILGIGVGGTLEYCALLAKKQLLRPLGTTNTDEYLCKMEQEILDKVNALGIGVMGLSGNNYCLGVHIAKYPTHISALPICVNFQCHAARHAEGEI